MCAHTRNESVILDSYVQARERTSKANTQTHIASMWHTCSSLDYSWLCSASVWKRRRNNVCTLSPSIHNWGLSLRMLKGKGGLSPEAKTHSLCLNTAPSTAKLILRCFRPKWCLYSKHLLVLAYNAHIEGYLAQRIQIPILNDSISLKWVCGELKKCCSGFIEYGRCFVDKLTLQILNPN